MLRRQVACPATDPPAEPPMKSSSDSRARTTSRNPEFLAGGGRTGALMRAHDWSQSPLGAPESWPQPLRTVVELLLQSRFPMFVAWGEDLGFLYNDSYAEILGAKHPRALGRRFRDIWSEIWTDISPLIDAAMAGQSTYREDLPLLMNRKGYDEQTWFTFSYSPLRDGHGKVAGHVLCLLRDDEQGPCRARAARAQRDARAPRHGRRSRNATSWPTSSKGRTPSSRSPTSSTAGLPSTSPRPTNSNASSARVPAWARACSTSSPRARAPGRRQGRVEPRAGGRGIHGDRGVRRSRA